MNDRTFKALSSADLQETPLASLDYEQQLFALTPQHLLFHPSPEATPQVVALQDITRIHSDQTGTLRVETGEATAITASLIGYDPNRVQRFFQLVRDTTARAKQTPPPPIVPVAPTGSPFGKATSQPQQPTPTPAPAFAEPVSRTVVTPVTPLSAVPAAPTLAPAPVMAEPVITEPMPMPAAPTPAPAPVAPTTTLEVTLAQAALLRRARSVGRLAGVCVLLALVLVAGSLGMAYVMWQHGTQAQKLTALWTVTMGFVTAIGLLVVAEIVRFLSALGHASAEQR